MSPGGIDQVFVASTAFGLATLQAAIQDGHYPDARRRILVTSNNAATPETTPEIDEVVGAGLFCGFDDVFSYNHLVAPQHPSGWQPRAGDLPIWERHLRQTWALPRRPLQLVVESIQAPPALVLAQTFPDARIDVYGDGLMSYGPTRVSLPRTVAARIERLLHLDLVPGVRPLLLSEFAVPPVLISNQAFTSVVDRITTGPTLPPGPTGGTAVLLGQYLAAANLLSEAEEDDLHRSLVRGAAAAGFRRLVFKPHPSAPPAVDTGLRAEAAGLGVDLLVERAPTLVERWFGDPQVGLVAGCFSTALLTAQTLYGLPTAQVGTQLVLRRLRPYANSNRVPAALVHHGVGALESPDTTRVADLNDVLHAVGFAMQPERYPDLRATATDALRREPELRRLLGQPRLRRLELPGARRARHPAKAALRRLVGPSSYARLGHWLRRVRLLTRRGQAGAPEPITTSAARG